MTTFLSTINKIDLNSETADTVADCEEIADILSAMLSGWQNIHAKRQDILDLVAKNGNQKFKLASLVAGALLSASVYKTIITTLKEKSGTLDIVMPVMKDLCSMEAFHVMLIFVHECNYMLYA